MRLAPEPPVRLGAAYYDTPTHPWSPACPICNPVCPHGIPINPAPTSPRPYPIYDTKPTITCDTTTSPDAFVTNH